MKIILYAAISLDGFIAREDGDSDWVSDTGAFEDEIKQAGAYVVGRRSYEQFHGEIYPISDATTMILTTPPNTHGDELSVNTPQEAVQRAKKMAARSIVVVGGSKTWQSFLDQGLCDEVVLDIEPIMLGSGMRFNKKMLKLELISSKELGKGVVQHRYNVKERR